MADSKLPRPGQVTLAGSLVVLGAAAAVISAWEQISGLHTIDGRDRARQLLAEMPAAGSGVGTADVLEALHLLALVTGACAAAAVVLGVYVLQRSKPARLVLSILAVPLFFAGMAVGGFWSSLAAAAVVLLWMPPARDWYDGVARPAHPAFTRPPEGEQTGPVAPVERGAQQPPATYVSPVMSHHQPPPWTGTITSAPEAIPTKRPTAVTIAAVMTWVASALFSVTTLVGAIAATVAPDALEKTLRHEESVLGSTTQVPVSFLIFALWFVSVVVVLIAVTASVFAFFAWRRQEWARIALMICSGVAALFFLLGTLSSPPTVLFFGAAVATIAFLLRPETRAWFSRR